MYYIYKGKLNAHLVGATPLNNMTSSVGMMKFPNEWKVIKFHGSKPPTRHILASQAFLHVPRLDKQPPPPHHSQRLASEAEMGFKAIGENLWEFVGLYIYIICLYMYIGIYIYTYKYIYI